MQEKLEKISTHCEWCRWPRIVSRRLLNLFFFAFGILSNHLCVRLGAVHKLRWPNFFHSSTPTYPWLTFVKKFVFIRGNLHTISRTTYRRVQNSIENFIFSTYINGNLPEGRNEGGRVATPTSFQYLILGKWRACDLNLVMVSLLASKYQDYKLRGL